MRYVYKVIPAPGRGDKLPGVKDPGRRFAASVEQAINTLAAEGWEYVRSDTLPSEERASLTQTQTVWRNLLVFRKPDEAQVENYAPRMLSAPRLDEADNTAPANAPIAAAAPPARTAQPVPPPADMAQLHDDTVIGGPPPAETGFFAASADEDSDMPSPAPQPGLPGALLARAARLRETKGS